MVISKTPRVVSRMTRRLHKLCAFAIDRRYAVIVALGAVLGFAMSGCGGGGYAGGGIASLSATSFVLDAGQSVNVTANLSGSYQVAWAFTGTTCSGAACGGLSSTTGATVTYTAPAGVTQPMQVTRNGRTSVSGNIYPADLCTCAKSAGPACLSSGAIQCECRLRNQHIISLLWIFICREYHPRRQRHIQSRSVLRRNLSHGGACVQHQIQLGNLHPAGRQRPLGNHIRRTQSDLRRVDDNHRKRRDVLQRGQQGSISLVEPVTGSSFLSLSNISLTAPTSGTYSGILFFQAHGVTSTGVFVGNLINSSKLEGAIYLPDGDVSYGVNAASSAYNILVAKDIHLNVNVLSSFGNDYSGLAGGSPLEGNNVALVQ